MNKYSFINLEKIKKAFSVVNENIAIPKGYTFEFSCNYLDFQIILKDENDMPSFFNLKLSSVNGNFPSVNERNSYGIVVKLEDICKRYNLID